jgi:hypothetical protein
MTRYKTEIIIGIILGFIFCLGMAVGEAQADEGEEVEIVSSEEWRTLTPAEETALAEEQVGAEEAEREATERGESGEVEATPPPASAPQSPQSPNHEEPSHKPRQRRHERHKPSKRGRRKVSVWHCSRLPLPPRLPPAHSRR